MFAQLPNVRAMPHTNGTSVLGTHEWGVDLLIGSTARAPALQFQSLHPQALLLAFVTMDVTKALFDEVLPAFRSALRQATFVAIDTELTGLHRLHFLSSNGTDSV